MTYHERLAYWRKRNASISRRYMEGADQKTLQAEFGMSKGAIGGVIKRQRDKGVIPPWPGRSHLGVAIAQCNLGSDLLDWAKGEAAKRGWSTSRYVRETLKQRRRQERKDDLADLRR